jgi:hypothetical protein
VGQSGAGTILSEDFSTDPSERGWIYMAVNPWALQPAMPPLVTWDAAAENLAVSWDPSKPTSLYQIPLGRALTESHTITFRFDLRFSTIVAADFFQIGIGLRRASYLEFDRTGGPFPPGNRCRDLFELAYLPKADPEWGGPWLQPTICTSDGQFRANFTSPSRALPAGKNLGFTLRYDPTRRSVLMDLTIDGVPAITASPESALLPGDEFFVDTLGIFIYGDVLGADPANDLLAGVVDNISVEAQTPSFVDTFELYR